MEGTQVGNSAALKVKDTGTILFSVQDSTQSYHAIRRKGDKEKGYQQGRSVIRKKETLK